MPNASLPKARPPSCERTGVRPWITRRCKGATTYLSTLGGALGADGHPGGSVAARDRLGGDAHGGELGDGEGHGGVRVRIERRWLK